MAVLWSNAPELFQFTPLREGRLAHPHSPQLLRQYFNSRPYVRGDMSYIRQVTKTDIFQFTPLREGRLTPRSVPLAPCSLFQFTPLREGRLARLRKKNCVPISIHAPT